jgi:hypothetical protein
VPLVIDGLNESSEFGDWALVLARLKVKVERLTHVLVVVTVRPSYADDCLPAGTLGIGLPGFAYAWRHACAVYFQHFKIEAPLTEIHERLFTDPLYLRVFCEAVG